MGLNLKKLCSENGFILKDLSCYDINGVKTYFRNKIVSNWRVDLVKELLLIRDKSLIVQNIDKNIIDDLLLHICTY